ncbi:NB-ARC-like protein, partial [Cynara cardunculus var. scolymus]
MNARDKDINSWLKQSDSKVLIICGMGGSGKTTLAEYIVSSNRQHFEIISILKDIDSIYKKQGNIDVLIQQFAKDIVGEGKRQISYLHYYRDRVLQRKKALISLDLKTDSLTKMDNLKLLHLNDVHLTGSYEDFSENLRWLCWCQFDLSAIPSGLFFKSLVAIDMRDSKL